MRVAKIVRLVFVTILMNSAITAKAVEVEVVGPCEMESQLNSIVELKENESVTLGDLTVKVLNANGIPFKGDAQGIAQIFDSPMGKDAIETLSSTQMRAYGWCVHVDNDEPAEMPDQVIITASVKKILWFYAYSLYDNGVWKDYCTPSWKVHSINYCKSKISDK